MIFVLRTIDRLSIDARLWTSTPVCPDHEVQCTEPESTVYKRYSLSIEDNMEIYYLERGFKYLIHIDDSIFYEAMCN